MKDILIAIGLTVLIIASTALCAYILIGVLCGNLYATVIGFFIIVLLVFAGIYENQTKKKH